MDSLTEQPPASRQAELKDAAEKSTSKTKPRHKRKGPCLNATKPRPRHTAAQDQSLPKHRWTQSRLYEAIASCKLAQALRTPSGRLVFVSTIMALIWGAMLMNQGVRGPCHSADWDLMSEVGRRLALGDTLYVSEMDQKGPLCYATYALEWLLTGNQSSAYLLSCVAVWLMVSSSSAITALIVEEARKPWLHVIAQACLAGVLFVPHVGCLEEWMAPFGLLGVLWVRRLADGKHVSDVCWVVVGLSAAYAVWAKFTCTAQFVFLLCYAATRKNTKGLVRAAVISLGTCVVASSVVVLWMLAAGSFDGMMEHYIHAATDGYSQRMSMMKHLSGSNPSTTHVTSFFVGLPLAIWSILMTMRSSRGRLVSLIVLAAGCFYIVCCFSTFVGYYRMQLAALVVLGACEITGEPWKLPVLRTIDSHVRIRYLLWIPSICAIFAATMYTCNGTTNMVNKAHQMREALHKGVGESKSVLVWQFDHTWVYGELGLDYYYPMPARYNASQDLWDSTAGADLSNGRWEYVIVAVGGDTSVGDNAIINGEYYPIVSLAGGMAVARVENAGGALITNGEYKTP